MVTDTNLKEFCRTIAQDYALLPSPTRRKVIVGKIRQQTVLGNDQFFCDSPRAKRLKAIAELGEHHLLDVDRKDLLNDAVSDYLSQRKCGGIEYVC
jgi:hypothetical protein